MYCRYIDVVSRWRQILLAAFLALTPALARADQLPLGAATGYNVFVFNNFSEYGTDAQGRMAVGGNFAPAGSGGFTIAGSSTDGAGIYDLVVGRNFTNSGNRMGGGDIYVGGNMTWNDPTLPNNAYVAGGFTNTVNGGSVGGTVYVGGKYKSSAGYLSHQAVAASSLPTPIDFVSARTSLDSLSTALAGEAPNGSVSESYGTYTLSGANASLNIFNLRAGSYNGATIDITAPAGSTVVVNVAGSSDAFSGGSINLNGVTAANVIFNFSSATALSLSSIAFNGTILAPLADFTGSWGDINGQLIANNVKGTTQLNNVLFSGSTGAIAGSSQQTPSAPEPSTWLMLLAGVGVVTVLQRKNAARRA